MSIPLAGECSLRLSDPISIQIQLSDDAERIARAALGPGPGAAFLRTIELPG